MAATAICPFDSLSDEMFLKIITMAKGDNHDFLLDELCNVSVRFRQIATDSSLWSDFVRITVRLPRYEDFAAGRLDSMVEFNDDFAYFSKVEFMVRKCINVRTTRLQITGIGCAPHVSNTLETVYKVAICPRGNLPYKQIYLINDQKLH